MHELNICGLRRNIVGWGLSIQYTNKYTGTYKYTGIFYRIRNHLPESNAQQLYFSFIYSRISYWIEVYGTAIQTVLQPLQVMQNHIIKILTYKPKQYPTNALYLDTELLKIKEMHEFKLYTTLYAYSKGKLPPIFDNILNPNVDHSCMSTRQHSLFMVYKYKNKTWKTTT